MELFKDLKSLVLDNNEIKSLKDFPDLPELETLWLNNNQLEDLSEVIEVAAKLPKLTYLSILKNPCVPNMFSSEYELYRYDVLKRLNNLKFLDSQPVTEKERQEAKIRGRPITKKQDKQSLKLNLESTDMFREDENEINEQNESNSEDIEPEPMDVKENNLFDNKDINHLDETEVENGIFDFVKERKKTPRTDDDIFGEDAKATKKKSPRTDDDIFGETTTQQKSLVTEDIFGENKESENSKEEEQQNTVETVSESKTEDSKITDEPNEEQKQEEKPEIQEKPKEPIQEESETLDLSKQIPDEDNIFAIPKKKKPKHTSDDIFGISNPSKKKSSGFLLSDDIFDTPTSNTFEDDLFGITTTKKKKKSDGLFDF